MQNTYTYMYMYAYRNISKSACDGGWGRGGAAASCCITSWAVGHMTTTPTTLSLPSWGALFVEGEGGGVGQGVACAYFSMIRQLDNIKFALLLPEFVYGERRKETETKAKTIKGGTTYAPVFLSSASNQYANFHQCNLTYSEYSALLIPLADCSQLKWLKNIFQAIFRAKEEANVFFFYYKNSIIGMLQERVYWLGRDVCGSDWKVYDMYLEEVW